MTERIIHLLQYRFVEISAVKPQTGSDGAPIQCMPQNRYSKAGGVPLNRHGAGPFCRLKLRGLPSTSGVYALTANEELKYIGIAQNLSERWGPQGYGIISPRNCYVGGQSTNCKINNRILISSLEGAQLYLWFCESSAPKPIEAQLIGVLSPAWNSTVPSN